MTYYLFQEGLNQDARLNHGHIEAVLASYRPSLQQHNLHSYIL
jgi:hypothetical protein